MNSFKSYGKVDEADQIKLDAKRKTRKRIAVVAISSLILVIIVVSAVAGTTGSKDNNHNGGESQSPSSMASIKAVCDTTLYPNTCFTSLSPRVNSTHVQLDKLLKLSVIVAIDELSKAYTLLELKNCSELLGLALDHLNDSLSATDVDLNSIKDLLDDLMTWISAAGTFQQTCIDSVEENVMGYLQKSTELTSNSLAIIKGFSNVANSYIQRRRLMSLSSDEMPEWLSFKDRKLLQKTKLPAGIKADVVVAQDGSGKFKKISDALKAVPDKSTKRFVIYVKKGIYYENVRVEKPKWNVMMIGDGMDSTIVSGRLNVVDGTPTFSSATFAVFGKGFIARDMGFRNTAGAIKHQAVALMSTADQSAFYRCRIDAFQDSLYAHSNRQFYRECNIYGTVDFIFGNSAVVLQNCNILPRRPMTGQQNTITAQGKFDPNQNTGISIESCTIWPYGNLSDVSTFLGRPWKNHSTTVYANNMMGSLIDPKGWLPWVGTTAPNTIFYAEFANYGPGADTKKRVNWKGLKFITKKQASKFSVKSFIEGDKWIKATGVPYKSGL
ncbi:putative pectinesterase/pectinesterase inhibitor 24 [Cynara cardunculus var. scolymus]|uniref:putative pectinesterase/pectinesterase inhibitor 24 n=1 Tax=Cynara cardunculus var. scolymus TaxID=59895 RepID=UPI000D628136|nr:putative pectinesterase/pectinesterase inhibitor 24 [Cynara cardunculus var. scolymus]